MKNGDGETGLGKDRKPQIDRLYSGGTGDHDDIGAMTPKERAERYRRTMSTLDAARLLDARSALVKAYRARPQAFPDGIDTKYDRWYRAEEWKDDGTFIGSKEIEAKAEQVALHVDEDESQPWVAAGVSRATWFRRQKKDDLK